MNENDPSTKATEPKPNPEHIESEVASPEQGAEGVGQAPAGGGYRGSDRVEQQPGRDEEGYDGAGRTLEGGEYVQGPWLRGAEADLHRRSSASRQPGSEPGDRDVGGGLRRAHGVKQHRFVGCGPGRSQALLDGLQYVIVGAEHGGDDELDARCLGGSGNRSRHIDPGMERLGEQQRHDHRRTLPRRGQHCRHSVQLGSGEIQVRGIGRDSGPSSHLGEQRLDPGGDTGMAAAVRQADQRRQPGTTRPGTRQSRRGISAAQWSTSVRCSRSRRDQRVSRCAVWLWQRGQNFFSSSRSGSFRRFFLVM